jgi:hypothetical protein
MPRLHPYPRGGRFLTPALLLVLLIPPGALAQAPARVQNGPEGSLRTPPRLVPKAEAGQSGPEEALLYRPANFLFDEAGHLFVVDSGNKAIQVYDREGRFLRRFGKEGEGPGEFRSPVGAYLDWSGDLIVYDTMTQRASRFSPAGEFRGSEALEMTSSMAIPARADRGHYLRSESSALGGGRYMVQSYGISGGAPAAPEKPAGLLQLIDEEGQVIRAMGTPRHSESMMTERLVNQITFAAAPGGKAVMAYSFDNLIQVFDLATGRLEREITRQLAFEPREIRSEMTPQTSTDAQGRGMTVVRGTITADQVTRDLAVDPQGRIWVLTNRTLSDLRRERLESGDPAGLVQLEVFAPDGRLLAALPLETAPVQLAFDPSGDLWLFDDETATFSRFQVVWP